MNTYRNADGVIIHTDCIIKGNGWEMVEKPSPVLAVKEEKPTRKKRTAKKEK